MHPTLAALLLLPGIALPPPDARGGRTVWEEGRAAPGASLALEVAPSHDGALLVELESSAPGDLDLTVETGDAGAVVRRRATSHRPRERLVVASRAGQAVRITVDVVEGPGGAARVGFTPLAARAALAVGAPAVDLDLDPDGPRAALVPLAPAGDWDAVRLAARRARGSGDVDLVVLDAELEVVEQAATDGPDEQLELEDPFVDGEPAPAYALALARGGPVAGTLEAQGPPDGQKAFPRSRLDRFLSDLGTTPEQRRGIAALRRSPDFVAIRAYVERYPGGLPLRMRAVPGLKSGGVERFGTYSGGVLTINPTIAGHRENVQELLDTLVHELVHALLDLPRGPGFPFGQDVLDAGHDPRLEDVGEVRRGTRGPIGEYLDQQYGPSASDPQNTYSDINSGAQRLIVKVIEETLAGTGLGHETLVFENVRARRGAKAPPREPERRSFR